MGDDVHMRTQASTNLLIRALLPHLLALESPARVQLGRFLAGNHLFFLNLAMAAARSLLAWAHEVGGSSIVVGMARNGTTFGVRLPGSDEWYLAPSPPVGHALLAVRQPGQERRGQPQVPVRCAGRQAALGEQVVPVPGKQPSGCPARMSVLSWSDSLG